MNDLLGPPVTHADYQLHVRALAPLLHNVPFDDRLDLLNSALARAVPRWVPTLAPWKPWIILVLRGEVARYYRGRRPGHEPLPDDLPGRDETSRILLHIDLSHRLDQLRPLERRALLAGNGGRTAHRARLRLRHIATHDPSKKEVL